MVQCQARLPVGALARRQLLQGNPLEANREITTGELVTKVLSPIWTEKHETAVRTRQRLETIFDYARARYGYPSENPALWRGRLRHILPAIAKRTRVKHLPALPYASAPPFMKKLRARPALSARYLELQILTATRPAEARCARWAEFDLEAGLWTIPKGRMKMRVLHRIPLSDAATGLLKKLHETRTSDDLVFCEGDKPLSDAAAARLLERMGHGDIVPHGFRSSFRTWAAEVADAPREVAEACLAHQVGNEVERSYQRGEMLRRRKELLELWASYLDGKVVVLAERRRTKAK